jgi:hypothetical protein
LASEQREIPMTASAEIHKVELRKVLAGKLRDAGETQRPGFD